MTAITGFQRNFVHSGVYSPFNRRLTRSRPHTNTKTNTVRRPARAIRIGDHINPYTGEILPGQAYLPLSTLEGTNRAIGVFGSSGSGKCLVGESGIRLKDGTYTTIEKLYNSQFKNSEVLSCDLLTYNTEFKKIINITRREIKEDEKIIKISTRGNHSLTTTGNHKIFIWDNDFVEKSMSEIKIGDFLISYRSNNTIDLQTDLIKDSEIIILAYILADGQFKKDGNCITFTKFDKYIMDDFENNVKLCGFTSYIRRDTILNINSGVGVGYKKTQTSKINQVKQFYSIFGLNENLNSYTKFVPDIVFKTTLRQKALFLNRLFSCDGYVGKREIEYSSNSLQLINGIVQLLLDFGIDSKVGEGFKCAVKNGIRSKPIKSYRLSIEDVENISKFNNIGLICIEKQLRLQKLVNNNKIKGNSISSVLPNIELYLNKIMDSIRPMKRNFYHTSEMKLMSTYRNGKNTPTKHTLLRLLNFIESFKPLITEMNEYKVLVSLINSNLLFYEINKIEEIKYNNYVYDLEIEDNHNLFIGNTIHFLVHNSVAIRTLVEYFAIEEGRCVIIFDDTKNQYWSFKHKQDRTSMLEKLKSLNIEPTEIPEVVVYSPAFDEPVLGFNNMQRDFHTDKLLSLKTSAITAEAFFELGNIDASGRMYHNQLKRILNVPAEDRSIDYINSQLDASMQDTTLRRSISSLKNIFNPLCDMGIIRDDGTDVKEMLHSPREGKPGRISVINLGTSKANDCRKNAVVSTICQQIFDKCREDRHIKPVIVLDEAKAYIGKKASAATLDGFSLLHLQGRAWDITRIWGYQNQDDIVDWVMQNNTNYLIQMTKSLPLLDGGKDAEGRPMQPTVLNDSGLAHIFVSGSGDPSIPDLDFYCKVLPCRTKHVD